MDVRLANTWRLTVNEKKFIETALASDLRVDGRGPLEYRKVAVKFGKEDGAAEVQLGQTHVMAFVTAQLVKPFRDRPNEGSLSIFTEFSPMADPSFEPGRPTESSVELGRVIDRGLRESRAIDTESLCVLAGELVWAIRIDLHMLDNGGNLVDAANIAALAALMTFRRPECTLGGEDGKEVIVHLPEVREPLPLIVHHLPISVTFGFFRDDGKMVVDPTHSEEAVMGGRMTATVNANGDICAIQKAGGEGVPHSVIMRCLRLASRNAETITTKIKDAALDIFNTAIVSPIYYVMFTSLTILASVIMFKDWDGQSVGNVISEICGFVVVLSGTVLLQSTKEYERSSSFKGNYGPLSPTLSTRLCAGNGEYLKHDEEDPTPSEEISLERQEHH